MNDEDLVQYEPPTWEPSRELADFAFQLHAELIRLGEEARPAREKVIEIWQQQGRILDQFYLNDELCKAAGCEKGWSEYSAQADVAEALGFDPTKMSPPQRSRICRLIIHSHYANRNLLQEGVKTRIAEALPDLDDRLDKMKEAETSKEEKAARQEYIEAVARYADMTSREVRQEVAQHHKPLCHVPPKSTKIGLYDTKDGDLATVRLTDHLAYYVISRLTRESLPSFKYDEDGIGYYNKEGEFVYVLRFEKFLSEGRRRKLADSIPNCQRR